MVFDGTAPRVAARCVGMHERNTILRWVKIFLILFNFFVGKRL